MKQSNSLNIGILTILVKAAVYALVTSISTRSEDLNFTLESNT